MTLVYQVVALSVFSMGLQPALGKRMVLNTSTAEEDVEQSGCGWETCTSFDESQDGGVCSCLPFSGNQAELTARAKGILYNMAQSMRYLSDYETGKSILQNMWIPTKVRNARLLSATFADFEYLQNALGHFDDVRQLADVPVKNADGNDLPAGVFPVMVEVWDQDTGTGEFIGETGVGLVPGHASYTLPLRANPGRSKETAKLAQAGSIGTVTFETDVEVDMENTFACAGDELCVTVYLTVKCTSAAGLPDLDFLSGTSDPYCKIRVKKDDDTASTKDSTPYISDDENPTWTTNNDFSYSWPAYVLINDDGSDAKIAWTLDQMSLFEQFLANTRFLAKHTVNDGKECDAIPVKKAAQQRMCDALTLFEEVQVSSENVEEVKKGLSKEDQATIDRLEAKHPGSFVQVADAGALLEARSHMERVKHQRTGVGCMACMSRRRGGGGGGGSRRRSGDGGGGGGAFVAIFFIIILLCLI